MITKSEISLIKSLSDKKSRCAEGLFVAQGEKIVGELLDSSLEIEQLYFTEGYFERGEKISNREMERISSLKTPSNILAVVHIPAMPTMNLRGKLSLALDGVQDPGNLGTIIRIADWFGIENILCSSDCADCFAPKVVQASMGALLRVNIYYGELTQMLSCDDLPLLGTTLGGEDIYSSAIPSEAIIVMGSEGRGISAKVEAMLDRRLYIPSFPPDAPPSSESLNVAVATAIVCAEARRVKKSKV